MLHIAENYLIDIAVGKQRDCRIAPCAPETNPIYYFSIPQVDELTFFINKLQEHQGPWI